jgi:hypothetical protein
MKHPNKFNTAKHSSNQKVGLWQEEAYNNRQQALKALEVAKQQENERKRIR